MNISWNGFGSFTMTGKPYDGEVTLVTDPFEGLLGLRFPRTLKASVVAQSHDSDYASNQGAIAAEGEGRLFSITHAGEYEVRGIFVKGITAKKEDGTDHAIYKFTIEGIRIGFLGALDRILTDAELEALGEVDILLVPMGGKICMDAKTAAKVVAQVEPRLVIPSYCQAKGVKESLAPASDLCKEIGCSFEEVNKAKIKKSQLPQEDMQVWVLSRA